MEADDGRMTAGDTLRSFRQAKGLTLRAVSNLAEQRFTSQALSAWERGEYEPGREFVALLDEVLDAGGTILDAFGYRTLTTLADEVAALRAQVEALTLQLAGVLEREARALGADAGRTLPRSKRSAGGSAR